MPVVPVVPKPKHWGTLPLFKKVMHYRKYLGSIHAPFVDKLQAKQIVKDILGDKIQVAQVVRVLESVDDLRETDLQPGHIIKATHGSGWNIFINADTKLEECKHLLQKWNRVYNNGIEAQYKYIRPRFFIEECVRDRLVGDDVIVYRLRCVYGKVIPFMSVTYKSQKNQYDLDWNLYKPAQIPFDPKPDPELFSQLIECAETLARPFEYVRMDFYINSENQIVFSEYTFTPNNGKMMIPYEHEMEVGRAWTQKPPEHFV